MAAPATMDEGRQSSGRQGRPRTHPAGCLGFARSFPAVIRRWASVHSAGFGLWVARWSARLLTLSVNFFPQVGQVQRFVLVGSSVVGLISVAIGFSFLPSS